MILCSIGVVAFNGWISTALKVAMGVSAAPNSFIKVLTVA